MLATDDTAGGLSFSGRRPWLTMHDHVCICSKYYASPSLIYRLQCKPHRCVLRAPASAARASSVSVFPLPYVVLRINFQIRVSFRRRDRIRSARSAPRVQSAVLFVSLILASSGALAQSRRPLIASHSRCGYAFFTDTATSGGLFFLGGTVPWHMMHDA